MLKTVIFVSALCLAGFAADAHAGQYNINATSCVPDAGAIEGALYHGSAGTVNFASGMTGDIVLYCPIPYELSFSPNFMSISYTITGTGASVEIQYIKMNMSTGAIGTDALATGSINTGAYTTASTNITTTYVPASYAYWVRVDINRSTTAANPVFYALHVSG